MMHSHDARAWPAIACANMLLTLRCVLCAVWQAEAVSAWVQEAVDKEEERRVEFLQRMQPLLPHSLLELLQERPASSTGCGGHARAPRMEVQVSARAKRLPIVHRPEGLVDGAALVAPLLPCAASIESRTLRQAHDVAVAEGGAVQSVPRTSSHGQEVETSALRQGGLEQHVAHLEHLAHLECVFVLCLPPLNRLLVAYSVVTEYDDRVGLSYTSCPTPHRFMCISDHAYQTLLQKEQRDV